MKNQPTLGLDTGPGKIELTTGSVSTPLMAFQSPDKSHEILGGSPNFLRIICGRTKDKFNLPLNRYSMHLSRS